MAPPSVSGRGPPESRLKILVACGAAAGISATFNAPIAGVFFALELILRDFEAEAFGVVVLSSFVADLIGRAAFGSHPFLTLPPFELHSPLEYPLYAGLGVVCAVVGIAFIRVLYGSRTSPTGSGAAPNGSVPPQGVSCSGSFCSACRSCTASAIRNSKALSADAM